ncbi:galactose oxidase [Agrocybe pediades]|nr:galactose oxidase [Agrocybe pediades]
MDGLKASSSSNRLPNVPEGRQASTHSSGPYSSSSAANSTSTLNTLGIAGSSSSSRRTASGKATTKPSNDSLSASTISASSASTVKRSTSTSSAAPATGSNSKQRTAHAPAPPPPLKQTLPKMPHDKDIELVPSAHMYWSKAPSWGTPPNRILRAHTVTLVDSTAWILGGCDDKDSAKDIYCLDTDTMEWTRPDTVGDIPPPFRAHTATLFDRKLLVFGGGLRSKYFDTVYLFDIPLRRWTKPHIAPGPKPQPRRAHTAVFYKGKVWVFGGGTGLTALSDLWTLDVSGGAGTKEKPMKWEKIEPRGKNPGPRGYHTANLVGSIMVVIGGSDGKDTFTEVWCLDLDKLIWTALTQSSGPVFPKRLAHSATQIGSFLFVMGGHNVQEYTSELILFNLVSLQYEHRIVNGKPPSPRGHHSAFVADSRLFVIGGANGGQGFYDDVYILDLAAGAYLPQVTNFIMNVHI